MIDLLPTFSLYVTPYMGHRIPPLAICVSHHISLVGEPELIATNPAILLCLKPVYFRLPLEWGANSKKDRIQCAVALYANGEPYPWNTSHLQIGKL